MAAYVYDDFRIRLTPRPGGGYDVSAAAPDGQHYTGIFRVPLSDAVLQRTVLHMARSAGGDGSTADANRRAAPLGATRDVGGSGPPTLGAQELGTALASALLTGTVGSAYDIARRQSEQRRKGLRLTLSLAEAPELMNIPWELLYRRPRFLASQRHTPLVRHLETGQSDLPAAIETTVRILGVVAAPTDLTPLDVAAEQARVDRALATVIAAGRVELDWLSPATPRCLRQALRDGDYHILHYSGHSAFSAAGEGVLYLTRADGRSVEVGGNTLANLLSDHDQLRLVVLNSCDGARVTMQDPFAGVATTLIQLGVPAVVAMQFQISDEAAILFADELFTNLIARQDPLDAAISEARKAILVELDNVEWATPVLFMRDPDAELFCFDVPPPPLTTPGPQPASPSLAEVSRVGVDGPPGAAVTWAAPNVADIRSP